MRFAVVGHVEWVDFLRVTRMPAAGEIVHVEEFWEEAAGGGAVATVQLAKLARRAAFFTALGNDERAQRSRDDLQGLAVEVLAAAREVPQRRAVTFVDAAGERTIVVIGDRLVAASDDPLPWDRLAGMDGVYFTGGDAGALRAARAARVLVATPRAGNVLIESGVTLDALVGSGRDQAEARDIERLRGCAHLVVTTRGPDGGTYVTTDGTTDGKTGSFQAAPLAGPVIDSYGAGDSFAAGLTFGLGSGMDIEQALAIAGRCAAGNLMGRGPYTGQPTAAELQLPPLRRRR